MPSGGPCHLIHGCTLSSPPEGASKTSTAVDVMLDDRDDYRLFHPGFLVVGCRSYDQAARKCTESIIAQDLKGSFEVSCSGHCRVQS